MLKILNNMKRKSFLLLMLCFAFTLCCKAQSLDVTTKNGVCRLTFYSPTIVRVTKAVTEKSLDRKGMVVTMHPQLNLSLKRSETHKNVALSSANLTVTVDKQTGILRFYNKKRLLLEEQKCSFITRQSGPDKGKYRVNQRFNLEKNETIYGLGTLQNGKLNRRNTHILMEQSNLEDFQNVIQSIKGWGVYWDNYSRTQFDDDEQGMSLSSEVGECIDYYFMYGGSADGVISAMRTLSGKVPMFPLWTFGYWQSKERYKSSREVTDVIRNYRKLGVPLDGIIQDWQYWGNNYQWNAMDFLADDFIHGQQFVDDVHRLNAHLMVSIWASFGPMTHQYKELNDKHLLYDFMTWPQSGLGVWPPRLDYPSGVRVYDAFSKDARDIYWKYLKKMYDMGVDAWWMDSTDPDCFDPKESDYDHKAGEQTWRALRNAFPLASVSGVSDNQRATSEKKRVFIMTRSSFAGQQRYGSNMWSGDVNSSWDMLRKQIPAGLNFSLTGNPNFNTDIGGFFCGAYNTMGRESAPRNPQYQELYVRWMQYGLFCPVFRSHGTDAPREIYQFGKAGEPVYDAIAKTIDLRYRLLPYIYSTAWQVTSNDASYLRPLFSDFASDKKVWDMADEFMFGQDILAAPIVTAQYTKEQVVKGDAMSGWNKETTSVSTTSDNTLSPFTAEKKTTKYLPKGTLWYDFWTGETYKGGADVVLTTSLDKVPMFLRAGSILPLAPVMQYTAQRKWDQLEIRVYPGADGAFTLYEDEGDNYNYEKGVYSTITFSWDDTSKVLTIGNVKGAFPGMLKDRKFHIVVVGKNTEKDIDYKGEMKQLSF